MFFDHSYANQLTDLASAVSVTPLASPKLALFNHQLASELGLPDSFSQEKSLLASLFEQNGTFNQQAIAQKYGGHQFGGWNPDLGDGRGLLLGEFTDPHGQSWDFHLKGAGQTPYSRFGDGRAVLRSTIREYLASEALHALGIPTSRALCLISSSEPVYREKQEKGAALIRICQSHIRFGHFEYFYHSKQHDKLNKLFEYTLKHHFAECLYENNPHLAMLEKIVESTAGMVAKWQAFGFCHGVMNTDNMSIHGITFDFGPYAFLDTYEPGYICNHSDHQGRYAFDQQPGVALWNLNALAHGFTLHVEIEQIKEALGKYEITLRNQYAHLMRQKMGFNCEHDNDMLLVNQWLDLLAADKRDYTQSFRLLSQSDLTQTQFVDYFVNREQAQAWFEKYQHRLALETTQPLQRSEQMCKVNPKFILRNYLAQIAIDRAEEGNFEELTKLLDILRHPFAQQEKHESYAKTPPDWGQSMEISCSS